MMKKTAILILSAACCFVLFQFPSSGAAGVDPDEPLLNDPLPENVTGQVPLISPDATYLFAQRDTCELYLDVYEPAEGSKTSAGSREKPSIIFVFGGGFIMGNRDASYYLPWFKAMADNGYRMIAIDYRLGLKGEKAAGAAQVNLLDSAIHMAVEDLFSAVVFLLDNADALGIDPENIVVSGSSAGAITSLQAEYELCNRTSYTASLPSDFQFAGVMSFSGAILAREGKLKFSEPPCPIMLLHGAKDKLINYKQTKFFKTGWFGSDKIAKRFKKLGYSFSILRYADNAHEIASIMGMTVSEQNLFIEEKVM